MKYRTRVYVASPEQQGKAAELALEGHIEEAEDMCHVVLWETTYDLAPGEDPISASRRAMDYIRMEGILALVASRDGEYIFGRVSSEPVKGVWA